MSFKLQILPLILPAIFLGAQGAVCQPGPDDENQWKDWQLTLSCTTIPRYLDYPGSRLRPYIKINVAYAQPASRQPTVYEDLFYAQSRPIGCNRQTEPIGINAGTAGVIKVTNVSDDQTDAAANAVLRVLLDVALRRCITKYVVVPDDQFNAMIASLCAQGMHKNSSEGGGSIALELVSDHNDEKAQNLCM